MINVDTAEAQAEPTNPGGVAAVNRALAIMEVVESAAAPISLTEIARRSGLYKSTVLRLLDSLQGSAYVARLDSGNYVLGPAILRMGIAYECANPLRKQLHPVLAQLVRTAGESASFHIRHGRSARLCVLRIDAEHGILDRVRQGDILPLDRGAAGKVITSALGRTGGTVQEGDVMVSLGERDVTCAGIAAPVYSAGGLFLGAVSLSGPKDRFTPGDLSRMRPILVEACNYASGLLGMTSA